MPNPEVTTDAARPADGPRVVMVAPDHPRHERLEGVNSPGECSTDRQCFATGCGGELCSADRQVATTCDLLLLDWPEGRNCGCVEGSCVWWHASQILPAPAALPTPATGVDSDPGRDAGAGEPCGSVRCKPPQSCIEYFGIAGPAGPAFRECAIRCKPGTAPTCPQGMGCVTVADGPGPVCKNKRKIVDHPN